MRNVFPVRPAMLLLLCLLAFPGTASESPGRVVEGAIEAVFAELEPGMDPERVRRLVGRALAGRVDASAAGRMVLGKHWRQASPEQRERVSRYLHERVIDGLALALARHPDASITLIATQPAQPSDRALVKTTVRFASRPPLRVDYRLVNRLDRWRLVDLRVEGVSLLATYRRSFSAQVRQHGLEALVASFGVLAGEPRVKE